MSGIQVRLSQSQFQKRMPEFIGKQINVVFIDDTVVFGLFEKVEGNTITLRNMRLKKKTHLVTDINEVYFDKNS
jgi:hypothetical protein